MKSNLKIISWNVNGIRSAYKKGFVDFLKKENPDIFCLQEIKADNSQFPKELFNLGYKIIVNSAFKKGYSGVAVFLKKKPNEINLKFNHKRFDREGRFIELTFNNFTLINLYIPQGGRDKLNIPYKLESYKKLFVYIKRIKQKNIILIGDFNIAHKKIDLARPKQNQNNTMFTIDERKQIDKLINLGFVDSFRIFNKNGDNYTWWSYIAKSKMKQHGLKTDARVIERKLNVGWRIDYAFVSYAFSKNVKSAYILKEVHGSDHAPIVIEINKGI